jgi:hypothetical protein
MVPVEMRAFWLLAVCALLLAAVLLVQVIPRRFVPWPVSVITCIVAAALAIGALLITGRP